MFTERLKSARKNCKISQKKLAQELYISQQAYAKYETGAATPNPETLHAIADLLGVSADYLLGRDISKIVQTESPAPLSENEANAEKPAAETGSELSEDAQRIAMKASLLSEESRKTLEDYIDFLAAKGRQ